MNYPKETAENRRGRNGRGPDGRFLPGACPGPGRPRGSKAAHTRVSDLVLEHLLSGGRKTRKQRLGQALDELFAKDPKTYLKVCFSFLPKADGLVPEAGDADGSLTLAELVALLRSEDPNGGPALPDGEQPDDAPPWSGPDP